MPGHTARYRSRNLNQQPRFDDLGHKRYKSLQTFDKDGFKVLGFLFHIQWGPAEVNELNDYLNFAVKDVNPDSSTCTSNVLLVSVTPLTIGLSSLLKLNMKYPTNETQNNFANKMHLQIS